MRVQFARWGNSLAVRVPRKVADALGIMAGSVGELNVERDQLVIAPRPSGYRLDDLLAGITPKNVHGEIRTGSAIGNEVEE